MKTASGEPAGDEANWRLVSGHYYIRADGIACFRAATYVFVVNAGTARSQVMQLMFQRDGSIFVSCPYFEHHDGVVSLVTVPAHLRGPTDISILAGGRVTSHLVKLAYHPDGDAHFSQDRRIRTFIRKRCPPLADLAGPFFSIRIQGLEHFEEFVPGKHAKGQRRKRTYLEARLNTDSPAAVKVLGSIFQGSAVRGHVVGRMLSPFVRTKDPMDVLRAACVCAPPADYKGADTLIVVSCETVPRVSAETAAHVSIMGGFDAAARVRDENMDTSFLLCTYPATDPESPVREIGTVDFTRH